MLLIRQCCRYTNDIISLPSPGAHPAMFFILWWHFYFKTFISTCVSLMNQQLWNAPGEWHTLIFTSDNKNCKITHLVALLRHQPVFIKNRCMNLWNCFYFLTLISSTVFINFGYYAARSARIKFLNFKCRIKRGTLVQFTSPPPLRKVTPPP